MINRDFKYRKVIVVPKEAYGNEHWQKESLGILLIYMREINERDDYDQWFYRVIFGENEFGMVMEIEW